jgi:peroxiredoxin
MTISEQVAALHAGRTEHDVFGAEQAALALQRVTSTVALGDSFPDGDLMDAHGTPTSIAAVRAGRPAVVVFYRGAWCPYCNIALRTYREELTDPLTRRGMVLVAVSPQTPDGSLTMAEKHDLEFPVLSDAGNQLARALGIMTEPSEAAREAQLSHGLDLAEANADGTIGLPMPTVAIIDSDGLLVWIDIHPDYSTRTEPQQVLSALAELNP